MTWTSQQVSDLCEMAGEVSIDDICAYLKKRRQDVTEVAALMNLDINHYERKMSWCPICGTFRTMNPECRVCKVKEQLDGLRRDNAETFQLLTPQEQYEHEQNDAVRQHSIVQMPTFTKTQYASKYERDKAEEMQDLIIERWELERLEKEKNRVKQETRRIRRTIESRTHQG